MNVTVKLFASHRERAGASSVDLTIPDASTAEEAFAALSKAYPGLEATRPFTTFARNRQIVSGSERLSDGDELALLQPVSGGEADLIEITDQKLSLDRCVHAVEAPDCGGIATFLGTVRDHSEGKSTDHLEYEAYPEMAVAVLQEIIADAHRQWAVRHIAVQHRTGRLEIGEVSVIIAASAPHRGEAFAACRLVIERLKAEAPIWKKDFGEGGEMWVGGPTTQSQGGTD
jgi:molybdopterin synthase catalytic subunit